MCFIAKFNACEWVLHTHTHAHTHTHQTKAISKNHAGVHLVFKRMMYCYQHAYIWKVDFSQQLYLGHLVILFDMAHARVVTISWSYQSHLGGSILIPNRHL